jgi:ABC-type glycerol-3-phosphate transport system substrate-binding protein
MNKKLGILLIGSMLVLAACGEEDAQPAGNEPVEEEATVEAPMTDAAEATSGEASPMLSKGDNDQFCF